MALILLPEEVLEEIVVHLSVKDLLACSAVCLAWREKFNVDKFWKKFCIKEITDYLEDVKSEVDPVFYLPTQSEERLEPLCKWRICYMRQNHVINNWKFERFLISDFRTYIGVVSAEVKIDSEGIHWLFLRTASDIEIWNINSKPHLYGTVPLFSDCPIVNVFVANKFAVITQWNVLSVYDLECYSASFKPVLRFLLEDDQSLPSTLWTTTNKSDLKNINEDDDFRYCIFDNLVVGYKRIPSPLTDLSMHIWSLSSGNKIKIESMWSCKYESYETAFTNIFKIDDKKALVRIVFIDGQRILHSQIFVYDVSKQKFMDTNIMFDGVVVWCGCTQNIIVTFTAHPGTIKFYNYSSGRLLSVKEIGEYTNSEQMQLVNSYLLYCTFNCMNVMDIHSQEVVYCLEFSFYSFVRRLTVIEPRFVVVWLLERGGSPGCPTYYQEVTDNLWLSACLVSEKCCFCSSRLTQSRCQVDLKC